MPGGNCWYGTTLCCKLAMIAEACRADAPFADRRGELA